MIGLLFSLLGSKGSSAGEVKAKHVTKTGILIHKAWPQQKDPISTWIQKLE
jgi:hypothetical protein